MVLTAWTPSGDALLSRHECALSQVGARSDMTLDDWLLEFYILQTSKVKSGWVLGRVSAHSWRLYSASPLGEQATSTMSIILS